MKTQHNILGIDVPATSDQFAIFSYTLNLGRRSAQSDTLTEAAVKPTHLHADSGRVQASMKLLSDLYKPLNTFKMTLSRTMRAYSIAQITRGRYLIHATRIADLLNTINEREREFKRLCAEFDRDLAKAKYQDEIDFADAFREELYMRQGSQYFGMNYRITELPNFGQLNDALKSADKRTKDMLASWQALVTEDLTNAAEDQTRQLLSQIADLKAKLEKYDGMRSNPLRNAAVKNLYDAAEGVAMQGIAPEVKKTAAELMRAFRGRELEADKLRDDPTHRDKQIDTLKSATSKLESVLDVLG